MDHTAATPLPGLVLPERFDDGPPRWYARRGRRILAGSSRIDVLTQLWDQDAAWLGVVEAERLTSARDAAPKS